jgi:heme-degrading monooxygenase HmoA
MDADSLAHAIQLIIAPVVMVSACGLVLGTVLVRYNAISDRLRDLGNERLSLIRAHAASDPAKPTADDRFAEERLREIDTQAPDLLRHHQLAHHAAQTAYAAIIFFIICMFMLAALAQTSAHAFATLSLICFLAGITVLFAGVVIIGSEIWNSQRAVQYEIRRVLALERASAKAAPQPQQGTVLQVTMLDVNQGAEETFEAAFAAAVPVIATATGYRAHELHRCIEAAGRYLLIVHWDSLEDHTVGFRDSPEYAEWRGFIARFCDGDPIVQHYAGLTADAAQAALAAD